MIKNLRNIAIIAHVDHGKTTLVNQLLRQSIQDTRNQHYTIDSDALEKERGITIFSKHISFKWKQYYINVIDTPGHADFGGEVERIMSMVDSVLLVVDAFDGPMPQTRFVTKKAFSYGLKPILVINKVDRPGARPNWVADQVFDLFVNLNANDAQLDFPIVYTSALYGKSGTDYSNLNSDMTTLYQSIVTHAPCPKVEEGPFQMQVSQIDYDKYIGFFGIGCVKRGQKNLNDLVTIISKKGTRQGRISSILKYSGLSRIPINVARSGSIVALTGLGTLNISDTICDPDKVEALPELLVEKPIVSVYLCVNNSPFSATEGKYITASQILNRLNKEKMYNIALKVEETKNPDIFLVSGRGELHLSILIENMRREGFELAISRPKVIERSIDGIKSEPYESIVLDIEDKYQGTVIENLGKRGAKIKNICPDRDRIRLEYIISSRNMIGLRSQLMHLTSGTSLIYSTFSHYGELSSTLGSSRKSGVLISNSQGKAISFALANLQNRGKIFIKPGDKVYEGQIIGIHSRSNDLIVNCLHTKKLTNMRASGTDEAIHIVPAEPVTLESALNFINDDELVEVTPLSIRLRKRDLQASKRKRSKKG